MDKKLKISLDIDDKAFTAAVKRMQDQLNQIQSGPAILAQQRKISQYMVSQGMAPLTGVGPREQEQAQRRASQEMDKLFQKSVTQLNLIKRLQADINKELASGLATEQRRADLKERLSTLGRLEKQQTGAATAAQGATVTQRQYGVLGSGGNDTYSMVKSILGVMGIGVGAAALVNLGKQAYTAYVSAPAQINLATGSAVQNALGYQNQNILSGNISGQTILQNQIAKGRGLAESAYDKQLSHIFSPSRLLGILGNSGVADILAPYSGKYASKIGQSYEAQRASEISGQTLEQAKASLAQNNSLMLANDFFGQTFNRNLGAERGLGLGTNQFKRLQMQMNNAGFLTDQGTSLLSQIQGAGGSAAGPNAGSLANLGLGAQRGLNLTNAGNVLGRLSGLSGSNNIGQTDETFKRLLEESIRKGFDKSENTEILRKFTESTAQIVYQGEASKGEDVERAARGLSQLLTGSPTMKQYEGATGAYQRYQGITSETSGRGGALGFAAFAGNKGFSKLGPLQIGNLMQLNENQITSTNSDVVAAAAQQGISPEQMVTQILSAKEQQGLSTVGLSKNQLAPLQKYLGGRGIRSITGNIGELNKMKGAAPEAYKAYQELQTRADLTGKSASDQEKIAMMQQFLSGPAGYAPLGGTGRAGAAIAAGTAGKKEEEYIAAQAAQEKQMVLNLKSLEDNLYPTAKGIEALTQAIVHLGSAAHMLTDEERARGIYNAAPLGPVETRSMGRTPSNGSKTRPGQ